MRTLSTLLLMLALAAHSFAHQTGRAGEAPSAKAQEEGLTLTEEREARAVAALFIKRFAEKHDIGMLIDELFVSDFTRRLSEQNERDPFVLVQREVPLAVPPTELRAYYTAVVNVWSLTWQLFDAYRCSRGSTEREEDDPKLEDAYPRAAVKFINSEPLLLRFYRHGMGMELKDDAGSEAEEADAQDDELLFADAAELAVLTSLLRKSAAMLRGHLAELQEDRREGCSLAGDKADEIKLSVNSMSDPLYGYDSGARLICVQLSRLHLDLVREAGRLKILSATPYF